MWSDALITDGDASNGGPRGIQWKMPWNGQHVIVGLTSTSSITSYPEFTNAVYFTSQPYQIGPNGVWGTALNDLPNWRSPDIVWRIMAVGMTTEYSYKLGGSTEWVLWDTTSVSTYPLRAAVDIWSPNSNCENGPQDMAWI